MAREVPAMLLALLLALLHAHPGSSGFLGIYKAPVDSTSISPLGGTVWSNIGTLGVTTPVYSNLTVIYSHT